VPNGATTGRISVTVGSRTVQSDRDFTVVTAPAITSVTPQFIERAASLTLNLTGSSLIGSSFSILPSSDPPLIVISASPIDATGTSALLILDLANGALGSFTVVATSAAGSSQTSPSNANSFVLVPPGSTDIDGDGLSNEEELTRGTDPANPDSDGDGFHDGMEVHFGSNPLSQASTPDISVSAREATQLSLFLLNLTRPAGEDPREAASQVFSINNLVQPSGTESREAVSSMFSLENRAAAPGPAAGEAFGSMFSLKNQVAPAGVAAGEAVGLSFSIRNHVAPPGVQPAEAGGLPFSIQNTNSQAAQSKPLK
jgi:hypothetical protein